jgi:hypothetical protein
VLTELYGQELADVLNVLVVCCGMIPYHGFPVSMVMKQHMNTKIMDLHTKLTNLVFHEIDRLNMNEEPINNCNPENQHQKS